MKLWRSGDEVVLARERADLVERRLDGQRGGVSGDGHSGPSSASASARPRLCSSTVRW